MDTPDDMNYLKRYVQNHPDNRMAWYLLGKQYMLEGKEAKANYCFLQSGSIYDAYERKQHPLANEPKQMIAAWNRKRSRRFLALRTGGAAAILLALMLAFSPGGAKDAADPADSAAEPATLAAGSASAPGQAAPDGPRVVVVKPAAGAGGLLGQALGALLGGAGGPRQGLAVALEPAGSWRLWTGKTRLLAQTERQARGGAEVALLDAKACACEPADAAAARAVFKRWSARQELTWTLASAIAHYREREKRWPASLADLVRPYPDNTLSGTAKEMKTLFAPLLRAMKAEAASGDAPVNGEADAASGAAGGGEPGDANGAVPAAGAPANPAPLPAGPLAIVVDKDAHRLAVVSGDVIVRSYPVGLGGAKTPDGEFVVSEKVRNPKGRTAGEFGTRGMALSDTPYAIHGTNDPDSIGKDESHGCIRMARPDIEELYDLVPLGTKVKIKSGVLPVSSTPAAARFRLQPAEDETNPAVVYEWLD